MPDLHPKAAGRQQCTEYAVGGGILELAQLNLIVSVKNGGINMTDAMFE